VREYIDGYEEVKQEPAEDDIIVEKAQNNTGNKENQITDLDTAD
jgi:hypothetical protein